MSDAQSEPPRLGSLAQSARLKELRSARRILIVIGVLSLLVDGYRFASAQPPIHEKFELPIAQFKIAGDQRRIAQIEKIMRSRIRTERWVAGGFCAVGAIFIGLGLALNLAPLTITVTALLLYLATNAAALALERAHVVEFHLVQLIMLKIFVVIGLVSAIRTAIAHRRGARAIAAQRDVAIAQREITIAQREIAANEEPIAPQQERFA